MPVPEMEVIDLRRRVVELQRLWEKAIQENAALKERIGRLEIALAGMEKSSEGTVPFNPRVCGHDF